MNLYLCKMDVEQRDSRGEPKLIACLGTLVCSDYGYLFQPWNSAHKRSRKFHPTMERAIPKWADEKYQGFTRLLGRDELTLAQQESSQ